MAGVDGLRVDSKNHAVRPMNISAAFIEFLLSISRDERNGD